MPLDKYRPRGEGEMLEATTILERPPLRPDKTAVVIIDVINRCCVRGVGMMRSFEACDVPIEYYLRRVDGMVVPNLNRLLDACRQSGIRVVHVAGGCYTPDFSDCIPQYRVNYKEWNARVGSWEMQVVDGVRKEPDDIYLVKAGSGGFSSPLDLRLRNMGIEQVMYTGVATNGCVLLTVTAGFDLGYHGWLVSDATATFSDRLQGITEELVSGYMAQVVSTEEMIAQIASARAEATASRR